MKFLKNLRFFVTGTHAYGPLTEGSDLDLVLLPSDSLMLKEHLTELGISIRESSEGYIDGNSFYFEVGGLSVNIITVQNGREYYLWEFRTGLMKQLGPIADKSTRIRIFRALFPDHGGKILKSEILDIPASSLPTNPMFPEPPRVDGFTYAEWESANPNFAQIALSIPRFAPFHELIQRKMYIINRAMKAPVL